MQVADRERLGLALRRLLLERAAIQAYEALDAAGVDVLLIKGIVLERLLYRPGSRRNYRDVDLFVDPRQWRRTMQVMAELGYGDKYPGFPHLARAPHAHTMVAVRSGMTVEIDLHFRMPAVRGSSRKAWALLSSDPIEIDVAGRQVRTTSLPVTLFQLGIASLPEADGDARHHEEFRRLLATDATLLAAATARARALGCGAPFARGAALALGKRPTPGGAPWPRGRLARNLACFLWAPDYRLRWEQVRVFILPSGWRAHLARNRAMRAELKPIDCRADLPRTPQRAEAESAPEQLGL